MTPPTDPNETIRAEMMGRSLRNAHAASPAQYQRECARARVFFKHNYGPLLPAQRAAPVLEIGCGMGHCMQALRALGYTAVQGIDLDSDNVSFCRQNGLTVAHGDGLACLVAEGRRYAAIIMNDVVEHLPKPQVLPAFKVIHEHLAPGGVFIYKTINMANPLMGAHSRYIDFTHETGWTEECSRVLLAQAGFIRHEVRPSRLYVYFANPLNYAGLLAERLTNALLWLYFRMNGRFTTHVFTKNLIGVGWR